MANPTKCIVVIKQHEDGPLAGYAYNRCDLESWWLNRYEDDWVYAPLPPTAEETAEAGLPNNAEWEWRAPDIGNAYQLQNSRQIVECNSHYGDWECRWCCVDTLGVEKADSEFKKHKTELQNALDRIADLEKANRMYDKRNAELNSALSFAREVIKENESKRRELRNILGNMKAQLDRALENL